MVDALLHQCHRIQLRSDGNDQHVNYDERDIMGTCPRTIRSTRKVSHGLTAYTRLHCIFAFNARYIPRTPQPQRIDIPVILVSLNMNSNKFESTTL
jgi:hypothetical protein